VRTWLVLDVSNLAYRAMYTTGGLSHGGMATGVLYGVFRDVISLQELFSTRYVAFCFDGGYDERLKVYPEYKQGRRKAREELSTEEQIVRQDLRTQLKNLRTVYLPDAGFQNVFYQKGFEADDLIASICVRLVTSTDDEAVVVSTDQDLWQCLNDRVVVWNPVKKKVKTAESFVKEWGVEPERWAFVKALAGCKSDGIPGIKGIGEKTAVKFLKGELKKESAKAKAIALGTDVVDRNLKLTVLPMVGLDSVELSEDELNKEKEKWDWVMECLGMGSLVGKIR